MKTSTKALIATAIVVMSFNTFAAKPSKAPASNDAKLIAMAKEILEEDLVVMGGTLYKNVVLLKDTSVVCGRVSARNAMNAQLAYKDFAVSIPDRMAYILPDEIRNGMDVVVSGRVANLCNGVDEEEAHAFYQNIWYKSQGR